METEMLAQLPLFEDVPEGELQRIAHFVEESSISEGKHLVEEGSFSNELMVIIEGTAEVRQDSESISQLGPGDVVGEMGLLERSLRSATVVATSPMRLATITRWELARMRRHAPAAVERLEQMIRERKQDAPG